MVRGALRFCFLGEVWVVCFGVVFNFVYGIVYMSKFGDKSAWGDGLGTAVWFCVIFGISVAVGLFDLVSRFLAGDRLSDFDCEGVPLFIDFGIWGVLCCCDVCEFLVD